MIFCIVGVTYVGFNSTLLAYVCHSITFILVSHQIKINLPLTYKTSNFLMQAEAQHIGLHEQSIEEKWL